MWLIARRTFAQGWGRLTATLLAVLFSVGLMAGSLQFALRAQAAVSGSDASEYARTDVLVQPPDADPDDVFNVSHGLVKADLTGVPGVAAVAGDASVPVTVAGSNGKAVVPPAGAQTSLRPWIADSRLNAYHLVSGRAPAAPGEVAIVRHVARAGKLSAGSTTKILLPKENRMVRVTGVVTVNGRSAVAAGDLVLAPPETVRQLTGGWNALWVKAAPGTSAEQLRADLARRLGRTATVRTAASVRNAQSADLSSAGASIGGSIGMIAMVAVFVGLFVVANTFSTLVRQRTRQLALLAAIGARPRQIKRLIRFEALALGLVASAGGLVAGYGVSEVLTRLFKQDGFDITAADQQFTWISLVFPFAAGVLVTQISAWKAARRAARVSPMEALRSSAAPDTGKRWKRWLGAFALFALASMFFGLVFAVAGDEGTVGMERTVAITMMIMMGAMVCVCALAVLAPFFVGPLGGLIGRLGTAVSGEAGRLARATISRSPRRVSSAASALMLGVALAATTGLLITSVNQRFAEAGRATVTAQHAISADGATPIPADLAGRVASVPGVTHAAAVTSTDTKLVKPARGSIDTPVFFQVTGMAEPRGLVRFGGHAYGLRPGEIALSRASMATARLHTGQRIVVSAPRGKVTLTVAGRFSDASHLIADQALVEPSTMDRLDPNAPTSAVLIAGKPSPSALAAAAGGVPGAHVYDRNGYVRHAAGQFAKGLTVIYGFLGMSLVIALFGMATTVSLSVAERTREFGLLGAVGATVRQIRAIVRWEAATVVVLGTLLGMTIAIGTIAGLHVATGSSFIRVDPPPTLLALVVGGAAAVALATSALPARRAAQVPVLDATKAE